MPLWYLQKLYPKMAKQQPASSDSSGPCVLCRNTSFRYSRAANVGKQKRCIIDRFTSTSLPDTACIYKACIMQVKHNIKNEHFHPRWLPKQNKTEQSCCIEYCKNPVYRNTNLFSHEEVAEVGVHNRKQLCTGIYPSARATTMTCTPKLTHQIPTPQRWAIWKALPSTR